MTRISYAKRYPAKARAYAKKWYWANRAHVAKVRRNRHIFQTYGINEAEYDAKVREQDGKYAICKQTHKRRLVVDHCHTTNRIRKLLCDACNRGLGLLGEQNLVAALEYVEEFKLLAENFHATE